MSGRSLGRSIGLAGSAVAKPPCTIKPQPASQIAFGGLHESLPAPGRGSQTLFAVKICNRDGAMVWRWFGR
jgi:hypothetical protein